MRIPLMLFSLEKAQAIASTRIMNPVEFVIEQGL